MFSTLVLIISIVLTTAVVLVALYFASTKLNGSGAADAEKLVLQGTQLLGAAELYRAGEGQWPASLPTLADSKYTVRVPRPDAVRDAASTWEMPTASAPLFLRTKGVTEQACRLVNRQGSLQRDGILRQAYSGLAIQCYAPAPDTFWLVVHQTGFAQALAGLREGDLAPPAATPPSDSTASAWYRAPSGGRAGATVASSDASDPTAVPELATQSYAVRQSTLSFGSVNVGEQATLALTVTNTGSLPFTAGVSVTVDGAGFGLTGPARQAGRTSGQCAGLPSGASCDVLVTWSPAYTTPEGMSWSANARVQEADAGTCSPDEDACAIPGVDVVLEGYANPSGLALAEPEEVAAMEELPLPSQAAAPPVTAAVGPPVPFSITYVGPAATEQEVDPLAFAGKHAAACETLMDTNNTKANECQAEFLQATLSGSHPGVTCRIEANPALGGNSKQIRCSE